MASSSEVVAALLEYLVDPQLPSRISPRSPDLSNSKQQSVAKQVHDVVLLYNYYQRKQTPEAPYLDFESFCKLAVKLRPTLVPYMKFINQCSSNDHELSVTEKAIQDACDIACGLDALKDAPPLNKWPIAKVSVLLVDSNKETCWLFFGSVTEGVWSLFEKSLDTEPVTVEQINDDSGFQQLAFLAVKESIGISESDLEVLEKHLVYSLSKEKTASCFYIMRCTKSINNDEGTQVSVKEIVESLLQGPLLQKISDSWFTTEVVAFFHLLPYATIMSNFILSDVSGTEKARVNVEPSEVKMSYDHHLSLFSASPTSPPRMDIESDALCEAERRTETETGKECESFPISPLQKVIADLPTGLASKEKDDSWNNMKVYRNQKKRMGESGEQIIESGVVCEDHGTSKVALSSPSQPPHPLSSHRYTLPQISDDIAHLRSLMERLAPPQDGMLTPKDAAAYMKIVEHQSKVLAKMHRRQKAALVRERARDTVLRRVWYGTKMIVSCLAQQTGNLEDVDVEEEAEDPFPVVWESDSDSDYGDDPISGSPPFNV